MMASMKQKEKDVNSINTIKSAVTVLKNNRDKVSFERAFMARYLLHLAGDIHQPLHSTCMYNETFPTGDLGGNFIKINTRNSGELNLHAFFDSMAG